LIKRTMNAPIPQPELLKTRIEQFRSMGAGLLQNFLTTHIYFFPLVLVDGTTHTQPSAIEDVGVDHRGFHIGVAEQFLHGADIVAGFEQVSGEGMAEGMAADGLGDAGGAGRTADLLLQIGFIGVMAAEKARARIDREAIRREDILPKPIPRGGRVLAFEGVRQENAGDIPVEIGFKNPADAFQMGLERGAQAIRKHGDAVLEALAVSDEDLTEVEIEILDAQTEDFHEPEPAAVEQLGHPEVLPGEMREQGEDLLLGQDGWQAGGAFGAHELKRGIQIPGEDVAEEKDQRVQRLVLGCGGDFFPDGEVGEEGRNFRLGQSLDGEGGVECQEAADPIHIRLFGADGIVTEADGGAEALDQ
jgi:hypothetical protein